MATIEDYNDIINKYLTNEINFETYSKLFNERTNQLNKPKNKNIDYINKQLITNN